LALIVPQTGRKSSRQFKYKPPPGGRTKTKKEEKFGSGRGKKIIRKNTDFQTATFPPLSFRP
jgi:hypothetical protein